MNLALSAIGPTPWERKPNESAIAFSCFEHFRDYGPERQLKITAKIMKRSERLIQRWAADYGWHARVLAYDQYTTRVKVAKRRRMIEKAQDVAYTSGEKMVSKALDALAEVKITDLSTDQIMKWLDTGSKLQRQALDAFAERVQSDPLQVNVAIDNRQLNVDGRPARSELAEYLDHHPERIPQITELLERALNNDPTLMIPTSEEPRNVTPQDPPTDRTRDLEA